MKKVLKEIQSWGTAIIIGFLLSLVIGVFIIQPYKVEGHSMEPTLKDHQRIYAWKINSTLDKLPEYGDIVIIDSRVDRDRTWKDDLLEHPIIDLILGDHDTDGIFYVKRIIGLPGDTIEMKDGELFRNGTLLNEPYIKEAMLNNYDQVWEIPEDHVFVMGDNRNNSNDSRSIGPIPQDHIMGIK